MADTRLPLERFSWTILLKIIGHLSLTDTAKLPILCKALLQEFQRMDKNGYANKTFGNILESLKRDTFFKSYPFFNSYIHAKQNTHRVAGLHILRGQMKEALAIIDEDPRLLQKVVPTITLKKHSTYTTETYTGCTLYQLALGTYDYLLYEAISERLEKYDSEARLAQLSEFKAKKKLSWVYFDEEFEKILKNLALSRGEQNEKLITEELTGNLATMLNEQNKEGMFFDLTIALRCFNVYEALYDSYCHYQNEWQSTFWKGVFGLIERHFSYYVAMSLIHDPDIHGFIYQKNNMPRETRLDDGSDFFNQDLGVENFIINTKKWYAGDGHLIMPTLKKFFEDHIEKQQAHCKPAHRLRAAYQHGRP